MLKLYKYCFYRITRFWNHPVFYSLSYDPLTQKVDPRHLVSSMSFVTLLQYSNLNTLLILPVLLFNKQLPSDLLPVIILALTIVNIFVINKGKLYDECEAMWKNESKRARTRNKWLLIVFFVASVIMMFVSVKIVYSSHSLSIIEATKMNTSLFCGGDEKPADNHSVGSRFPFAGGRLLANDNAAAALVGGEDEHLGDLHVGGGVGGVDGHVGDVVAGEGFDTLVDVGGALGVTMETGVAEIGLHEAGLEVGDADGGVGHVEAQAVGDGLHGRLGGAIDVAIGVGRVAGHGADVDDMAAVALHHARHYETCHSEQALDVSVHHGVPVVVAAFVLGLEAEGEAGVVHQHVDVLPFGRQALDALRGRLAVAHVEEERQHLGALGGELLADFLQALGVAAGEDETVAVGGEFFGASEADAARRACNQYSLVHYRSMF